MLTILFVLVVIAFLIRHRPVRKDVFNIQYIDTNIIFIYKKK